MEHIKVSERTAVRIKRLRDAMMGQREVSIQRAVCTYESYKITQGKPASYRRAKALERIMESFKLSIGNDELLVGRLTDKLKAASATPEGRPGQFQFHEPGEDKPSGPPMPVLPPDDMEKMREIDRWWIDHPIDGGMQPEYPEGYNQYTAALVGCGPGGGHHSIEYRFILEKGAFGLISEIDDELAKTPDDEAHTEKRENLKASKIALGALVCIARRYSGFAAGLAERETDPVRKSELLNISRICAKVPAHPAESFEEAIQAVWFTNLALLQEDWGAGIGFMRADQYLYPYYKSDLEKGSITPEQAYALIAMLLIKTNEELTNMPSMPMSINITLGGVDIEGNSAVNDLSYLFLYAENDVRLNDEDIIIRVSENMPDDFLLLACEVARNLNGKMKFVGDKTIIAQMLHDGRPLEWARDYCITGCNSATIPGRSFDMPGGLVNLPALLDLTLHNGYWPTMKMQVGPYTGDPRTFTSYNELWTAFEMQCRTLMPIARLADNAERAVNSAWNINPLQSILNYGYIEKGIDVRQGGMYPEITLGISLAGAPNVGDALAVAKKLVFEDKTITMERLLNAIDNNFEGEDELLALIDRVPKFGNNDDYVDSLVNDVLSLGSDIIGSVPAIWGAKSNVAAAVINFNIMMGQIVGALPDGRKAGEPISDGGISPYRGRNRSGPTATLLSVAKLDHMKLRHGEVLNMRFDPAALDTDTKLKSFAQMVKTYFALGGFLVQFNIVTTETLRAAQEHPDEYRDLIVRVATYAMNFVDISREEQDDIIARYEFGSL